jgi:FkbM family methyltransferase
MRQLLATTFAATCRTAPFERGRWRLGSLAARLFEAGALPAQRRTIATRHGFVMSLDLRQLIDREIYCQGEWEPLETALFARVLRPGDRVVDVGANIGWFSLLAARLVGPEGQVHSFEANRATFALLEDNLSLNACTNVTAQCQAVGEEPGLARIAPREAGNAGADGVELANGGADAVPLVRLDQVLGEAPLRLLKLDIEGWEAKALRGAEGLLRRAEAPALVFEFTPEFLTAAGDDPRELVAWLTGLGYAVQVVDKTGMHAPDAALYARRQSYLYCTKG